MKTKALWCVVFLVMLIMVIQVATVITYANTVTPISGITVTDSLNNATLSNGSVTANASASWSQKTNTITIKNSGSSKAKIVFDYAATGSIDTFSESEKSGKKELILEAAETYELSIKNSWGMSTKTATLVLSNFSYTEIVDNSSVIMNYNSSLGSVTAAGATVSAGGTVMIPSEGVALVAIPASGAEFVGWINADDNTLLSRSTSYTLIPFSGLKNVQAIFEVRGSGTAWFLSGDTKLYSDFAAAMNFAKSASPKMVVIANSGIMASGTYTIPAGVTFLLPYSNADLTIDSETKTDTSGGLASTLIHANVAMTSDRAVDTYVNGSITGILEPDTSVTYTLTIPAGTTINVEGKMVVGGTLVAGSFATQGLCGAPAGAHVNVNLEGTINVKSGGVLSCCGYIRGSGTINVASNGKVYTPYIMMDHKDGHYVYGAKEEGCFPFYRHSLINIQSRMLFESGADLCGYVTFFTQEQLSGLLTARYNVTEILIVGSSGENGVFLLGEGATLEMTYNASKTLNVTSSTTNNNNGYYSKIGRTTMSFDGNVSLGYLALTINVMGSDYDMSTQNSVFPLPYNYNIIQKSGTFNVAYNLALLPGASFTVNSGAEMTVASSASLTVFDGFRDYSIRNTSLTLGGNTTGGTWAQFHYPSSADLRSAGFSSTAELIMNGTLTVNGSLGGTVQASGTTGKIVMNEGAGKSVTTELGVVNEGKVIKVFSKSFEILGSCGKTTRTLEPKVFLADGTHLTLVPGATYIAAGTGTNTLNEYTYGVYISETATSATTETKTDLNATITGVWKCVHADEDSNCKCDYCGVDQHTPGEATHENVKDATCTAPGSYDSVVVCSVCNKYEISRKPIEIPAPGHTEVIDEAKAPTCSATGLTEGKHCSACGEVLAAQQEVAVIPHTEVIDAAKAATCTETGLTEGKHCSVCNEVLVAQTEVAITAHSYGEWYETVAPTESTKGENRRDCANCDAFETTPVAEAAHSHDNWDKTILEAVAPTCTATGLTEGSKCSKCGEILVAQEPVDALGHVEVVDAAVSATCTEDGKTEGKHCSVCEEVLVAQETVKSPGHNPGADANCTTAQTCTVCGEELTAKLGHTKGEVVQENRKAPTCYAEGSVDNVVYCTVCKAEVSRKTEPLAKVGHTPAAAVQENVVDSSCSAEGSYDEVVYCSVAECKAEISRTAKTIEKKEHTKGDEIRESVIDATCGASGSYTSVYNCTVCGQEASRTPNVVIPATGDHNYTSETERVPATCTVDGYYIMKCACGATQETRLSAPGHKYSSSVTAPTCTEGGYTTYTCHCGDTVIADTVSATGHKDNDGDNLCDNTDPDGCVCGDVVCNNCVWDCADPVWSENYSKCTATRNCVNGKHFETVSATVWKENIEATCTDDGRIADRAQFSDDSFVPEEKREQVHVIEVLPAAHKLEQVKAQAATCTEIGWDAYDYCTVCDYTTYAVIPASGHSYTSVVTSPTCAADGYTTHTCSACSDSYVDSYVEATGEHVYTERGWSRKEYWSGCANPKCDARTDVVARTYNITIVDYWENTTVRREYTYGKYLWLNYSTSNVLELTHHGWQVGDKVVHAYEVWEAFDIDENTKELFVTEVTTSGDVKPGAIMMSVNYNPTEQGKTMTVDLFIYVDSMEARYKPIVKLDGRAIDEKDVEIIDPSLMMYFVSIELSADQLKQGGTNAQITVDYDRNGTADKTIDSVVLTYQSALETYLQNLGGDHIGEEYAGALQQNAIDCVVDYGMAVQYVFGNSEGLNFGGYPDTDIEAYAKQAPMSIQRDDNIINGITFKWGPASVNFESEYCIRYKFTLAGADGYTPTVAQLIVRNSEGQEIGNYKDLEVTVVDGQYAVMYPVPASDLSEANTTVQITVALCDEAGNTTSAQSSEIKYGIYAYLTRQIHLHTKAKDPEIFEYEGVDKTEEYVDMLVSLIRLGESVDEIEKMTSNKNSNE